MSLELHTLLNKSLLLWPDLTGIDPTGERFHMGDYDIIETYRALEEAQKLDYTGLTTLMLLDSFVEQYSKQVSFSVRDFLDHGEAVNNEINKFKELIGVLRNPLVESEKECFLNELKGVISLYNLENDKVLSVLEDRSEMAFIRRDALKAVENLKLFQFLSGEKSTGNVKYFDGLIQFWNIDYVLSSFNALNNRMVYLSLMREKMESLSFFSFVFRDGDNFYLLTDKTELAHPKAAEMSRGAGRARDFANRAFRYHFPYQLLNFELSENEKELYFKKDNLPVLSDDKFVLMGRFKDFYPEQIVWLTMVLDLIKDKYFNQSIQKKLSYSASMIKNPKALLNMINVPVKYEEMRFPYLTADDVTKEKLENEDQWKVKPVGNNKWLEDRFKNQIVADDLNLTPGCNKLLELSGEVKESFVISFNAPRQTLTSLDANSFGTQKDLEKDYKWHARHNMAVRINEMAKKEFEEKKDEISAWFKEKILSRKEEIINDMVKMELLGSAFTFGSAFDHYYDDNKKENILKFQTLDNWRKDINSYYRHLVSLGGYHNKEYKCCITENKASFVIRAKAECPQHISALTGVAVDDLPIYLKNYNQERYYGNSILQRIDPMEWVVKNPWSELNFGVIAFFSKRGLNKKQKELGVKLNWEKFENNNE